MAGRTTQHGSEVIITGANSPVRVTQAGGEAMVAGADSPVRVTQFGAEVLIKLPGTSVFRPLTEAMQAEIQKAGLYPALFVEAEFQSGPINVWTGFGAISWDGKTWTGSGLLGLISPIIEVTEIRAEGVRLQLSGIPAELISKALDETRQGKPVEIWLGFLDENGNIIIDPYPIFGGRVDGADIEESGDTATIQVRGENYFMDMNQPCERRYTHEDQQINFPGDLGFEYMPSLQQWDGIWGKAGPGLPVRRISSPTSSSGGNWPPGGYTPHMPYVR